MLAAECIRQGIAAAPELTLRSNGSVFWDVTLRDAPRLAPIGDM
jgi:hypothetical protein